MSLEGRGTKLMLLARRQIGALGVEAYLRMSTVMG